MKEQRLRVVILNHHLPFSNYNSATHKYEGLYVRIWEELATRLHISYDFFRSNEEDDQMGLLKNIANGQYDIGLGRFSISTQTMALVDFLRPIELSTIQIYRKQTSTFFQNLFAPRVLLEWSLVVVLFFIFVLWYMVLQKKKWSDAFLTYWIALFDNKTPPVSSTKSWSAYLFLLFSSLFSFLLIFYVFTLLVKSVVNTNDEITKKEQQSIRQVYVVRNSLTEYYAHKFHFQTSAVHTYQELNDIAMTDSSKYIMADTEYMNHYSDNMDRLITLKEPFLTEEVSIAIRLDQCELLRRLNVELVRLKEEGILVGLCREFLSEPAACKL